MLRRRPRKHQTPQLRFTPTAWAKLLWLRDRGETEIGGFGISASADLLLVEDFVLVAQQTTAVTVAFDDRAVADFFDQQIDAGRRPEQCGRIWLHTHPGHDPTPSAVDEETFQRVFGRCDWAVMGIVARHGASYARLHWQVGPGGQQRLRLGVDYAGEFLGSDHEAWEAEYDRCVWPVTDGWAGWEVSAEIEAERCSLTSESERHGRDALRRRRVSLRDLAGAAEPAIGTQTTDPQSRKGENHPHGTL